MPIVYELQTFRPKFTSKKCIQHFGSSTWTSFWETVNLNFFLKDRQLELLLERPSTWTSFWKIVKLNFFLKDRQLELLFERSSTWTSFWKTVNLNFFLKDRQLELPFERPSTWTSFWKTVNLNFFLEDRQLELLFEFFCSIKMYMAVLFFCSFITLNTSSFVSKLHIKYSCMHLINVLNKC